MVQVHPQWVRTVELVRAGRIGKLSFALGSFGYYRMEPENVRNVRDWGGGGLLDIGCYPIKTSRMVFGEEPLRVSSAITRDARFGGIDILTSAILEFPSGHCVFTCGTQIALQQSMCFYGTHGRIQPELPFNATPGGVSRLIIDDGRDLYGGGRSVEEIAACDQYTLQGDLFSRAVQEGGQPPVPLEDALHNLAVIDAVFRAAETGRAEAVEFR